MGIHGMANSFKKRNLYNSKHRVFTIKKKQKRLKWLKYTEKRRDGFIDPDDLELMHEYHSKKTKLNNVTISSKKRRKLLKAARRQEREQLAKAADEEEEEEYSEEEESPAEVVMKELPTPESTNSPETPEEQALQMET